jgi:hypothetical protein
MLLIPFLLPLPLLTDPFKGFFGRINFNLSKLTDDVVVGRDFGVVNIGIDDSKFILTNQ